MVPHPIMSLVTIDFFDGRLTYNLFLKKSGMDTWNAGSAYFKRQLFKNVLSKDFRFEVDWNKNQQESLISREFAIKVKNLWWETLIG